MDDVGGEKVSAERYGEAWADVYDEEHASLPPSESQLDFLAELAGGGRALELGIGTGRVALPLAARGVAVEGLDASPSMVRVLRAKAGGAALPVTVGDMADLAVDGPFRLVYVVFNTFFSLLEQADQVRCFERVAAVLEPGGSFVLECFVPDPGRFDRGQSLRVVDLDDETVRIDASRHDPVAQRVRSGVVRLGDGPLRVRPVQLRYAWPAELDLMARIYARTAVKAGVMDADVIVGAWEAGTPIAWVTAWAGSRAGLTGASGQRTGS